MKTKVQKIVVLASGSGTTLQAIINAIEIQKNSPESCEGLNMSIEMVISDNPDAFALMRAKKVGIDTYVLNGKNVKERDEELCDVLKDVDVQLVVLAGYLKLIGPKMLSKYTIINTHPSLLPKYGGKGMHGMHVHQAVVDNHEKETGVTVHFVNSEYDKGSIIWQTHVPIYEEDTAEDVSTRVQAVEKPQLVSILKAFSDGKIDMDIKE